MTSNTQAETININAMTLEAYQTFMAERINELSDARQFIDDYVQSIALSLIIGIRKHKDNGAAVFNDTLKALQKALGKSLNSGKLFAYVSAFAAIEKQGNKIVYNGERNSPKHDNPIDSSGKYREVTWLTYKPTSKNQWSVDTWLASAIKTLDSKAQSEDIAQAEASKARLLSDALKHALELMEPKPVSVDETDEGVARAAKLKAAASLPEAETVPAKPKKTKAKKAA